MKAPLQRQSSPAGRESRLALVAGALLGLSAVILGAFAAHALQGSLDARAAGWYELAVTYQFRHALALLCCGVLQRIGPAGRCLRYAAMAWIAGVVVFCGSLYIMAFSGVTRWGMVTPVGGLLLVIGWSCLVVGAWQAQRDAMRRA